MKQKNFGIVSKCWGFFHFGFFHFYLEVIHPFGSCLYVKRIREKHLAILKENNIPGKAPGGKEPAVTPLTRYPGP